MTPDRWSLRRKLLVLLVCASAAPLLLVTFIEVLRTRDQVEQAASALLEARADQLRGQLDDFNLALARAAERISLIPQVAEALTAKPADRAAAAAVARRSLSAFSRPDPRLRGIGLIDTSGTMVLSTEHGQEGRSHPFRACVDRVLRTGDPVISDVHLASPELSSVPSISYCAPVRDEAGKLLGLVTLEVRAAALWDVVRASNGRAGEGSFSVLFDAAGVRIAHSFNEREVFRPASALSPAVVEEMVAARRFGERTRALLEEPSWAPAEFARATAATPLPGFFEAHSPANQANNLAFAQRLRSAPWTVFYLVPRSTVDGPTRRVLAEHLLASCAIIVLTMGFGLFATGRMLRPIRAMTLAAQEIRDGRLTARVDLSPDEELRTLGLAFNDMAGSLASAQQEMEDRVRRRTLALEAANDELGERNLSLAARTEELTSRRERDVVFGKTLATLAGQGSLDPAIDAALREANAYLGALVLICYAVNDDRLDPMASVGGVGEHGAEAAPIGAHAEEAFRSRRPVVLEVPEAQGLRFDAVLSSGTPRVVALVPLVVGDRRVGLLACGTAGDLSPDKLSFLSDLALPLGLTITRAELDKRTARYAVELARRNLELRAQAKQLASQQLELEAKNRDVQRANQLKSEFLANMSHELRTPLNAVIGFSDLLLADRSALSPTHIAFVEDILSSGRHLLKLINAVLDLAKIEAGAVTLDLQPVAAAEVIADACSIIVGIAHRKRVQLVQGEAEGLRVFADPGKLQQILINLLSNAVKFSPDGATVEVRVEAHAGLARFSVRDHGPGVPAALRGELFQPFVQGESPLVKKHEGTGLGLAISRRLVEQHGGQIGVESEDGDGSTFWFTLPVHEDTPGQEAVPEAPAPLPGPAPKAGTTLVVLEDDAANLRLLRFQLETEGYTIAEAARGPDAIALAVRLAPAAILLDLILSDGEDGFSVLEELKRRPETRDIPVIVISVLPERKRALALGAVECFLKPLDPWALVACLRSLGMAPDRPRRTLALPEADAPRAQEAPLRPPILVVDNNDTNRSVAQALLQRRGHPVLLAASGAEGIELARSHGPALVLMDLAMPGMDGFAATRTLKGDPRTAAIPVVAFTALAMRGDEERALAAGFDGYLTKPVDQAALDATLERFIRAERAPQATART